MSCCTGLETAFAAQRRFAASASHELRTPLAMMRTSLDVAIAKPEPVPAELTVLAGKLREGLDQADRLVENPLLLARAQYGESEGQETIPLGPLAPGAGHSCLHPARRRDGGTWPVRFARKRLGRERTSRSAAASVGPMGHPGPAPCTAVRGAPPLRKKVVSSQQTTRARRSHPSPFSAYSRLGGLRQDPGRAAESAAGPRTDEDAGVRAARLGAAAGRLLRGKATRDEDVPSTRFDRAGGAPVIRSASAVRRSTAAPEVSR